MKTVHTILYYLLRWVSEGPITIVDGVVTTASLGIIRMRNRLRLSSWVWDRFRAKYIPK